MQKYLSLLTALSFVILSCSCSANKTNVKNDRDQQNETINKIEIVSKISFKKVTGRAILVGNKIKLFDNDLNLIEDISNLKTKFIEITGISDSIFNDTKDICNAFWYVKIKTSNKEGIVNGRCVFKIENSN